MQFPRQVMRAGKDVTIGIGCAASEVFKDGKSTTIKI